MEDRCHKLANALAEFTTHLIDRYDTEDQSARNQILVKGVFAGASCGSLVDYAKKMRSFACESMSVAEIAAIATRSSDGRTKSGDKV